MFTCGGYFVGLSLMSIKQQKKNLSTRCGLDRLQLRKDCFLCTKNQRVSFRLPEIGKCKQIYSYQGMQKVLCFKAHLS